MKYSEDVFAYVFEEIFRFCEIESQKAERRADNYSSDTMVAYSEGQMLGYERVCRKIEQLKAYIESVAATQEGETE